jgi:phage protein D
VSPDLLRQPVECVVLVDDEEIPDLYPYLTGVEIRTSRSAATTCAIRLDTLRDEQGEWLVQDRDLFVPWKRIRIEARFGDRSEEVMRGYIREVVAEHPLEMASSRVTVTAQDASLFFDREHVRRVWSTEEEPVADGDIAAEIASAADPALASEADDGLENTSLNQDGTTIDFLKKRAEANGFELFFRRGTLHFHAPRLEEEPQPTIMLYAGPATNCLRFEVKFDGHKPDRVLVERAADTGTDPEVTTVEPDLPLLGTQAATSESMGLPTFEWRMSLPRGATRAEADARAQAAANKNAWKIQATGELDGALYGHVLLTHATVEVDGAGSTYGGKYYVDEVIHDFSHEGYRQRFTLLRNATGQQP